MSSTKKRGKPRERDCGSVARIAVPPTSSPKLHESAAEQRERDLRALQVHGARKIAERLQQMHDYWAVKLDSNRARRWLQDTQLHLEQQGILVSLTPSFSLEVLSSRLPGDSWRAFQLFESWFVAKQKATLLPEYLQRARAANLGAGDLALLIGIANAFGKSERWLMEAHEDRAAGAKGGRPAHPLRAKACALLRDEIAKRGERGAIARTVKALAADHQQPPDRKSIAAWASEDGLLSP